ncbi:MAG: hypothetical protein QGF56_03250 [Verrucomicrobiota bacterium]|nr:hypothetical protein [Verrucomicrobiota bacterium]MDP6752679.1 hypothetical protein [Verrucomicrobiota bacterium]
MTPLGQTLGQAERWAVNKNGWFGDALGLTMPWPRYGARRE